MIITKCNTSVTSGHMGWCGCKGLQVSC